MDGLSVERVTYAYQKRLLEEDWWRLSAHCCRLAGLGLELAVNVAMPRSL
jgi:hypothetical protein